MDGHPAGVRWAAELSGEHATLPRAEARTLFALAGAKPLDGGGPRVQLAEASADLDVDALTERLALSWRIVQVHAVSPLVVDAIADAGKAIPLDGERFAVRCSRLAPELPAELGPRIERRLGEALRARGTVDLDAPERTVRVLLGEQAILGLEAGRVDRSAYEQRHVEARPYFSPVSLHPRLARALVNLGAVEAGDRLWDPFVGTGGIALEAALVGCRTLASDVDPEMVEGTRATLAHFGAEAELREGDVADVADGIEPVDAIVTDPPYGRASSTNQEELGALYDRFLRAAADVLAPDGRLVCVLPDPEEVDRAPAALEVLEHHEWYVHNTLTRHVFVLERR